MQILHLVRAYWAQSRGAAAAEFAFVLMVVVFPLLNVVDFGMYIYQGMELNEAAQVAAQAALATCTYGGPPNYSGPPQLPATVVCTGLSSAETTAAQSTSLGSGVTITSTTENYYCTNSSGSLVTVGTFPNSMPADCSSVVTGSKDLPGDYILITVSYNYTPFFTGVSMTSLLTSPITRTAWMRLS